MNANWNPTQYDQQPLPHQTWGPAVINRARIHGHETIIDAGCGTGRDLETVTQLLQERTALAGQDLGGNTHGFDLNTDMLTKAAERFHHYPTRWQPTLTEANTLNPWPVSNADLAYTVATFHWVPDHQMAFAHAANALKPGGRFIGECGGAGNIANVVDAANTADPTWMAPNWNFAGVDETVKNLELAGFRVDDARLRPHPVTFPNLETATAYLKTVVLHTMGDTEILKVAEATGNTVDYVRLEWEAVKK